MSPSEKRLLPPTSKKSTDFHVLRVQPTPKSKRISICNQRMPIISSGTKTFENADDAKGDSFAEALFEIYGVESVYLKESFVTITKSETVGWHTIFEKVGETIENKIRYYDTSSDKKEPTIEKPETDSR